MLDIRYIRDNPDKVQQAAKSKGYDISIAELLQLDDERRSLQQQVDELREKRNANAATMKGGKPSQAAIDEGKQIKIALSERETYLSQINEQFTAAWKLVPNMPWEDVPVGQSEEQNVEVKVVGEIPTFDFEPKNHADIAATKGWIDKERAAKVTGARFAYVKGDLVKLQFAIIQFVIDTLTDESTLRKIASEAGIEEASDEDVKAGKDDAFKIKNAAFEPVLTPLMLRTDMYDAMDRLEPQDDRYKIEGEELWLQGSAEHVLGSMHSSERLSYHELPKRYLGYATSFRKEAGTYGKDMEGIIRMHQFDKLEMESITTEGASFKEHEFLIAIQEYLLQQIGLPYHVLMKCSADIGKPNARGVDMEVWLPSQQKYRETHTADYMTDYQTRRLNMLYRPAVPADSNLHETPMSKLAHTNDATAFALGRALVAIIENYQTVDGNVCVPEALQPYLGGRSQL